MKKLLTTIFRWLIAVIISIGLLAWAVISGNFFIDLIGKDKVLTSEIGKSNEYAQNGGFYNKLLYTGIALGAGLTFVLLLWNKNERHQKTLWIYIIFLLILVPFSLINYIAGDWCFARWKQASIDLVICVLGLFVLLKILKVKTQSSETSVMKALAIFFISSQAILIPSIYFILWFFNFQNAISDVGINFSPSWITYFTTIGGLVISVLNYRLSLKKNKINT